MALKGEQPAVAEINSTVHAEHAENAHANLGHPLMEVAKFDEAKFEAANQFLTEQLPDFQARIAKLVGNQDADKFFEWLRHESQHEDNVLYKVLCQGIDA